MNTIINLSVPYEKAGLDVDIKPTLIEYAIPFLPEVGFHKRPAVVICPGGGYDFISEREGIPIALRFAAHGISAFVLKYTVRSPFPTALLELSTAMAYVRQHAEDYDIDPERIFVCGFSAGGHLAASLSVFWDSDIVKLPLSLTDQHRPNGTILSYPVILAHKYAHEGSILSLLGQNPTDEQRDKISLEKFVSNKTPPTFLWHTASDDCVPVENTLLYCMALSEHKIPFECHVYPTGGHGLALCDDMTALNEGGINKTCSVWITQAIKWLRGRGAPAGKSAAAGGGSSGGECR